MLKIGFFGDGLWAIKAIEAILLKTEFKIEFVVLRHNSPDKELMKLCKIKNLVLLDCPEVNAKEFIAKVKTFDCHLFISISFNQIFRKQIIETPKYSIINYHAGKLPFYRGRNILNWALINDEKEFGLTVHYVDEGIDTGDIILQKTYKITDNDNYQTLLKKAQEECPELITSVLELFLSDIPQGIHQSELHSTGFYCGERKPGDEIINWNQSSRDVFNFIRALVPPGPSAVTYINNKKIFIKIAKEIDDYPVFKGIPGQVIGKEKAGVIIKTANSAVLIEVADDVNLKIGDRLMQQIKGE